VLPKEAALVIAISLDEEMEAILNLIRHYWQLVACAMQLLKEEWREEEILEVFSEPSPCLSAPKEFPHLKKPLGKLSYPGGYFYFVAPTCRYFAAFSIDSAEYTNELLRIACVE
jgi:hypothetical protein